jgi:hypothetical protein
LQESAYSESYEATQCPSRHPYVKAQKIVQEALLLFRSAPQGLFRVETGNSAAKQGIGAKDIRCPASPPSPALGRLRQQKTRRRGGVGGAAFAAIIAETAQFREYIIERDNDTIEAGPRLRNTAEAAPCRYGANFTPCPRGGIAISNSG